MSQNCDFLHACYSGIAISKMSSGQSQLHWSECDYHHRLIFLQLDDCGQFENQREYCNEMIVIF